MVEDGFLHCCRSVRNEKFWGLNDLSFLAQVPLIQKEFSIKIYFLFFLTNSTASYTYSNCQTEENKKNELIQIQKILGVCIQFFLQCIFKMYRKLL